MKAIGFALLVFRDSSAWLVVAERNDHFTFRAGILIRVDGLIPPKRPAEINVRRMTCEVDFRVRGNSRMPMAGLRKNRRALGNPRFAGDF